MSHEMPTATSEEIPLGVKVTIRLTHEQADVIRVRLGIAKDRSGKFVPPASACRYWTVGDAIAHVLGWRVQDGNL